MSESKLDRANSIIGGGAAGLTAAQYGARANLRTVLVEELAPGGQALVIEGLENYPGFPEKISGFEFAQRFTQQAEAFGAELINTTVNNVKKTGDYFTVSTDKGDMTSYVVILATGAKHRHLDIPGENEYGGKGVSYCATCDGPFFRNKRILVVGGGDAACDEALFLSKLTKDLVMIHRKDRFRAQRSLAERVLRNEHIDVRFNHELKEITGDGKRVQEVLLFDNKTGNTYKESFDAVFIFVGSLPQSQLISGVELDETGYVITDTCMQTSIEGLFAVGDVRATPFRQLVVAASEGAIASHCASQYIDELQGRSYS